MNSPELMEEEDYRLFLNERREALGLTVREVSRRAGLASPTYISLVVNGHRDLAEPALSALAPVLGLSEHQTERLRMLVEREAARKLAHTPAGAARLEAVNERLSRSPGLLGEVEARVPPDAPSEDATRLTIALGPSPSAGGQVEGPVAFDLLEARTASLARRLARLGEPSAPPSRFLGLTQAVDGSAGPWLAGAFVDMEARLRALATPRGGQTDDPRVPVLVHLEHFPLTRVVGTSSRPEEPSPQASGAPGRLPSIYAYDQATRFVEEWRRATGHSIRWLAGRLDRHHSVVGRALEKGSLSPSLATALLGFFDARGEFSSEEAQFFAALVALESAPPASQDLLQEALARLRVDAGRKIWSRHSEEFLGDWVCAALSDLTQCLRVTLEDGEVGALLDPPVDPTVARDALRRLTEEGLLRLRPDGSLSSAPFPLWMMNTLSTGELDSGLLHYHLTMHRRAEDWLARSREADGAAPGHGLRSFVLELPEPQLPKALALMEQVHDEVTCHLGDVSTGVDRVWQLNFSLAAHPVGRTGETPSASP